MVTYVFIPPLGHDHKIYNPLHTFMGDENVLFLDYPYFDKSFPWDSKNLIEELAKYFSEKIGKLDKVKIVGVSLGATISLRIKEILGEKVCHLYLIASGGHKIANFRKEMILSYINSLEEKDFLLKSLEVGSQKSFEESEFKKHFHNSFHAKSYWNYYTQVLWNDREVGPLVPLMKASIEINFETLLAKYQKEITIIWGEKDRVFSMRFYEKFQTLCKESTFHLLKMVGHFLPLETPEKLANILKE